MAFARGLSKIAVGASERFSALVSPTAEPHLRQKLVAGNNSAPHKVHFVSVIQLTL
jgi:hypothetical protein